MVYEEILIKQNRHWRGDHFPVGVERDIKSRVESFLKTKYILAITGVRRSGKSYLLYQIIETLLRQMPPENILYVNFDDPAFMRLRSDTRGLDGFYSDYLKLKNPQGRTYLFFDEVQSIPEWEKWVKSTYDLLAESVKFIVTGSNSTLLSSDLATLLTGRNLQFEVFPFNFNEVLRLQGEEVYTSSDLTSIFENNYSKKDKLRHYLSLILRYGSFPEILQINEEDREFVLKEYYKDILYRDIVPRFDIRHVNKLEEAAYYLLSNIANSINYHKMSKLIGVHENTIKDYLSYFERSYLSFQLSKFSYSIKEQMKSPKRVYFIDCGMRNAISFRFSQDTGRLMENLAFIDMRRRGCEIFYWKDDKEVDFAEKQGLKITKLLQVSYDTNDPKTRKREESALLKGMDSLELDEGFIITDDYFSEVFIESRKIRYVPLWAWLLRSE